MNLARLRATWTGSQVVGPSVTTFYFDAAAGGFPAAVKGLFTALAAQIPSGVQITVPNSGDILDSASGALVGTWSEPGGGVVSGTGTGTFILGTGYRMVWNTNGIRNRRHVRGTTFIVPVVSSVFDASGRITGPAQTVIANAQSAYLTAVGTSGRVWSRPKGFTNGEAWTINGAIPTEQPSWLRSRRV